MSPEAKETLSKAVLVQKEVAKLERIDDDATLKEANDAKVSILTARAEAVSKEYKAAVKVFDRSLARINKVQQVYQRERARNI